MPATITAMIRFQADQSSLRTAANQARKTLQSTPINLAVRLNPTAVARAAKEMGAIGQAAQRSAAPVQKLASAAHDLRSELASAARNAQRLESALRRAEAAAKALNNTNNRGPRGPRPPGPGGGGTLPTGGPFSQGKMTSAILGAATGFAALSSAAAGLGRTFQNNVKSALEFQRQLVRIRQVSDGTASEIAGIGQTVTSLSTTLGVSSGELIQAGVTLKQAGFSIRDVRASMDALAKSDLAPTFDGIGQSTEGLIASMRQFRLGGESAGRVLGSMNAVAASFAVESDDLIAAVQRSGAAFAATGGQLEEYLSLVTAVRATTRESAETIGTGLRTIFTRLQRPKTVSDLAAQGIDLRYSEREAAARGDAGLAGQSVDGFEAIRRISVGVSGLRSTDPRFAAVAESIGGYRQISKVLPLIREFGTAQQALNVAKSGELSLTLSAEQAQDAYLVKLTKVRETWLALGRDLVDSNGFSNVVGTLTSGADAAAKLVSALSPLIPLLAGLGAAKLAGLVAPSRAAVGSALSAPVTVAGARSVAGRVGPAGLLAAGVFAPDVLGRPGEAGVSSTRAGVGGAVQGAAIGAAVGSVAGPVGIALGGAVGALQGFTSAVREAESVVRTRDNEADSTALGLRLDSLSKGGNASNLVDATNYIQRIRGRNREEAADAGTKRFLGLDYGFDAGGYSSALRAGERAQFGPRLSTFTGALNQDADRVGRARPGGDIGVLTGQFSSANKELLSVVASLSDRKEGDVLGDFRKVIAAAQTAAKSDRARQGVEDVTARTVTAFGRLVDATERASRGLTLVDVQAAALAGDFKIGEADPRSLSALAPLGEAGRPLGDAFRVADEFERVLPGILARTAAGNPLDGDSFSQSVRAGLADALGPLTGERGRAADVLSAGLDRGDLPDILRQLSVDATSFSQSLLSSYSAPARDAVGEIGGIVRSQNERVASLIAAANDRQRAEGTASDRLAEISLSSARLRAEQSDRRPADVLSVAQLSAPFDARQRRLAGDAANNPAAIGRLFADAQKQIGELVAGREGAAPEQFRAYTSGIQRLARESDNLRAALSDLADTSKSAAGIQERLVAIQSDRESRLQYGEKFVSADRGGRRDLTRNVAAAVQAGQAGSLRGLSIRQQQRAIEGFNSLGQSTVDGLGGRRADEVKRELIGEFFGGILPPDKAKEENDLKGQLKEVFATAEAAQRELVDLEQSARQELYSKLDESNNKFLAGLKSALAESSLADEQVRQGQAGRNLGELRGRSGSADLLRGIGVVDDAGLDGLRARRSDLSAYAVAAKTAAELSQDRQRAAAIFGDGSGFAPEGSELNYGFFSNNRRGEDAKLLKPTTQRAEDYLSANFANVLTPDQRTRALADFAEGGYKSARIAYDDASNTGTNTDDAVRTALRNSLKSSVYGVIGQDASAQRTKQNELFGGLAPAVSGREALDRAVGTGGGDGLLRALDSFDKESPLTGFADRLRNAQTEFDGLTTSISKLRAALDKSSSPVVAPTPAAYKAMGGSISSTSPKAPPAMRKGTDDVMAVLSPGEFVVRAGQAATNREMLESINDGKGPVYRANGGWLDRAVSVPRSKSGIPLDPRNRNLVVEGFGIPMVAPRSAPPRTPSTPERLVAKSAALAAAQRDATPQASVWNPYRRDHTGARTRFVDRANVASPNSPLALASIKGAGDNDDRTSRYGRTRDFRTAQALLKNNLRGLGRAGALSRAFAGTGQGRIVDSAVRGRSADATAYMDEEYGSFFQRAQAEQHGANVARRASREAYYGGFARIRAANSRGGPSNYNALPGGYNFGQGSLTRNPRYGADQGLPNLPWTNPIRFNLGGIVPGQGIADRVPALLAPGEGILNRNAVQAMGPGSVLAANAGKGQGEAFSGGGSELSKALTDFSAKSPSLASALTGFGASADRLIKALTEFPAEVKHEGRHEVTHHFTGLEALDRIGDALRPVVEDWIHDAIDQRSPNANPRSPGKDV